MTEYRTIDLNHAPDPAFVIAYYSSGIEIGYRKENKISYLESCSFPEEDLMELHIFNQTTEFRAVKIFDREGSYWKINQIDDASVFEELWKIEPKIGYEGDESYPSWKNDHKIDEYMEFYGESWKAAGNGFTVLGDRKGEKTIYLTITREQVMQGLTLGVRNYLIYDENDRIMVYNYRLMGIFCGREKEETYPNSFSIRDICTKGKQLLQFQ